MGTVRYKRVLRNLFTIKFIRYASHRTRTFQPNSFDLDVDLARKVPPQPAPPGSGSSVIKFELIKDTTSR